MADIQFLEPSHGEQRGLSSAAALAREQLRYAIALAESVAPAGERPNETLIGALVQAMATNYAAVK